MELEHTDSEAIDLREAIDRYYRKMLKLPKSKGTSFYTDQYQLHFYTTGGVLYGNLNFHSYLEAQEPSKEEQIAKLYEENFYDGD